MQVSVVQPKVADVSAIIAPCFFFTFVSHASLVQICFAIALAYML